MSRRVVWSWDEEAKGERKRRHETPGDDDDELCTDKEEPETFFSSFFWLVVFTRLLFYLFFLYVFHRSFVSDLIQQSVSTWKLELTSFSLYFSSKMM